MISSVRRLAIGVAGALLAIAVNGCGDTSTTEPAARADGQLTGEVVVLAAASLTESFTQIGADFEQAHPDVTVTFNFAGSATLAQQINQGAPADVFASASPAHMQTVIDAGNGHGSPTTFARNQLVIAVPADNPAGITTLADLATPGVKVALCAAQVPCGAAAVTALHAAGVDLTPVTLERDVRGTLSKVALGEVDAALVYRTDAAASTNVETIEFAESANAINDYPIVALAHTHNPSAAAAFVEYVLSEAGEQTLVNAGFQPPPR